MARVLEFGSFRFDGVQGVLWRAGEPVRVAPKALDLLAALLASPGEVMAKADLLRRAWPDVAVEEANISVNVSILRRALGDSPDGRPWIETVPRRGYRFAGPVSEAPRARPRSLAVLPFRALDDAIDAGALGLAMADAIITRLSATGGIDLRPTSAIQRYLHADVAALEVARALGVEAVLEGRIQRAGTRLRVSAQLIAPGTPAPVWADHFDHESTRLFELQDAVADRLAAALALGAPNRAGTPAGARQTRSLPAYEAFARGRFFWSRLSRSGLEKAVACFREAADLDPGYAAPHAGLADACLAAGFAGALAPREAWAAAEHEANRALELDGRLPDAWVSRAWVRLLRDWDWPGAELDLREAAERDAGSAAAHQWRGLFLALAGRPLEARESLRRAQALDPASIIVFALEGLRLALEGDHQGALDQQRRCVELDPHHFLGRWALGTALQGMGRFEQAAAEHRLALTLAEEAGFMRPVLARSLALAGQAEAARAVLRETDASARLSPYQEATVLLALDEPQAALQKLHAACEARDPWVVLLPGDPMLAPLRDEPALQALARRVRP